MNARLAMALDNLRALDVVCHARFQNRAQACQNLADEETRLKRAYGKLGA